MMNHNRQLELLLLAIAAEAELLAQKVASGQLWEGDVKRGVSQISGKLSEAANITKNDH